MKDKLPEVGILEVNRRGGWLSIISGIVCGIVGGLVGLSMVFNKDSHWVVFSVINLAIIGAIIGVLYGRIFTGKKSKPIIASGIVGGFFGGLAGSGGSAEIYTYFFFGYVAIVPLSFLSVSFYGKKLDDGYFFIIPIYTLVLVIAAHHFAPTLFSIRQTIFWGIISFIPYLNLLTLLGVFWAATIISGSLIGGTHIMDFFSIPYFAVPLFSFLGYLAGCKIIEDKKLEEPIKEIPEGGLLMAEDDPVFPKDVNKDISPVAFSEKAMIHDLLRALDNKSLLLTKLQSWGARARGQDQLRAFEMIRETLVKETDIIKAYTANQQARLDFENLKQFSQYLQKEELKTQLAELEEKLKRIKLEGEYNSLTLQRKIEGLKKTREATESKIERIKKEQLEKVDFQEEIRKVKTRKLADRVEYLYNRKKEIRKKYSPEEAEEIIDELDRTMVEEGLKEE